MFVIYSDTSLSFVTLTTDIYGQISLCTFDLQVCVLMDYHNMDNNDHRYGKGRPRIIYSTSFRLDKDGAWYENRFSRRCFCISIPFVMIRQQQSHRLHWYRYLHIRLLFRLPLLRLDLDRLRNQNSNPSKSSILINVTSSCCCT